MQRTAYHAFADLSLNTLKAVLKQWQPINENVNERAEISCHGDVGEILGAGGA